MAYRKKVDGYRTAVFDFETDPFKAGRFPKPFAAAFKSEDGLYQEFWGENCAHEAMRWIDSLDGHYLIYAHNGGKFDFHFLFDYIEEPVFIVNSRLVEFSRGVKGRRPHHVFRDSLAIIPVPLASYQKTSIDYTKFEADRRELHKAEILAYLRDDCDALLDIVSAFRARFEDEKSGLPITVGQAALREFRNVHSYQRATRVTDALMREYYFGGRVQCFAAGVLQGPWQYFDVNSSYPTSMRNYMHPLTDEWEQLDEPPDFDDCPVWFATIRARQRNALPVREEDRTEFDVPEGVFRACSHELVPAIRAGMVEVLEWINVEVPELVGNFAEFVDKFYAEKASAKKAGRKADEMFAKFMLNSCYGKLGQNPEKYREYAILRDEFADAALLHDGFEPDTRLSDIPFLELWSKPAKVNDWSFHNVGIAASITSASRSIMLDGLRHAVQPIYCDTDSVICRDFHGRVDATELGAWKAEDWKPPTGRETWRTPEKDRTAKKVPIAADYCAVAGRKMYCLFNRDGRRIIPIKWASKGGDVSPLEIIEMAEGGEVEKTNEVPTYSLAKAPSFVTRKFRKTVADGILPF